jgi:hypothetical protein
MANAVTPQNSSEHRATWKWAVIIGATAALLVLVLLSSFYGRLVAAYELVWGKDSIERLFYEDLGLSRSWSEFIAVIGSFFYALAWVPLSLWTYRVVVWRFNGRQFVTAFVCWLFVYGHAPLAHALLGSDVCFNQRTGVPLKWYVQAPNGEITLFDSGGFDTAGARKLPVTPDICKGFARQIAHVAPHRITASVRELQFFDPNTGHPLVWYHKNPNGAYELYDAPGYSPGTSDPLVPVSKDVVPDIIARAPERCFTFNGERVCQ